MTDEANAPPGGEVRRRRRRRRRGGHEAGDATGASQEGGDGAEGGGDAAEGDGGDEGGGAGEAGGGARGAGGEPRAAAEGGERGRGGPPPGGRPPQQGRPQGQGQSQGQPGQGRSARPDRGDRGGGGGGGGGERGGRREGGERGGRREGGERGGERGGGERLQRREGGEPAGPGTGEPREGGEPASLGAGEAGGEAGGERQARPEQQRPPRGPDERRQRRGERGRGERGQGGQGHQGERGQGGAAGGASSSSASGGASAGTSGGPSAGGGRERGRDGRRDGGRDGSRDGSRDGRRDGGRDGRGGNQPGVHVRGGDPRAQRGGERGEPRGAEAAELDDDMFSTASAAEAATAATREAALPRLSAERGPARGGEASWDDDDDAGPATEAKVEWGRDDDGPAAAITLPASLPAEPDDDPDPSTQLLDEATDLRGPRGDVMAVVGVRFTPAGRVSMFEAGAGFYAPGDQVVVDSERGPRVGTVAVASERRLSNDRGLRRVLRLAAGHDLEREAPHAERTRAALRLAKDRTAALGLPVKVFRAELQPAGGRNDRLLLYITTEERVDLRELVRDLSNATASRVELRQLGARDEAKAIGGIGSCGLTLCCTTWLPEFVPVSIKMAKDQGLVLNPTKVAGQCGRLKCCLVYEQAGYAELRKGLPKLGKRVITARGEGRVVEVDVLRQRVRVSYGPGESEVMPAGDVRPMFPSGNMPPGGGRGGAGGDADPGEDSLDEKLDDSLDEKLDEKPDEKPGAAPPAAPLDSLSDDPLPSDAEPSDLT